MVVAAMLSFQGEKVLPRPPADVWEKLSDARFLVQCIPDVQSVSHTEARQSICIVRPGFAFVRGTVELTLQVGDAIPGTSIFVQAHSKGIGSHSVVEAELYFTGQDQGTRIQWRATIQQLGGLLKAVPQGLIKAAAQKVIADVWQSVEARLAAA
jgi:carbon monoxide dehydrogenase subunit G